MPCFRLFIWTWLFSPSLWSPFSFAHPQHLAEALPVSPGEHQMKLTSAAYYSHSSLLTNTLFPQSLPVLTHSAREETVSRRLSEPLPITTVFCWNFASGCNSWGKSLFLLCLLLRRGLEAGTQANLSEEHTQNNSLEKSLFFWLSWEGKSVMFIGKWGVGEVKENE